MTARIPADGVVLYFLLDLPGDRPLDLLDGLLPRLAGVWGVLDLVQVRAKAASAGAFVGVVRRVREAVEREALEREIGRSSPQPLPRIQRSTERGLRRVPEGARPLVLANDRLDVALAAGANGVHVGAEDLPPEAIRELPLPPGFVVGLTCHTLEELRAAPGRGADYLGVGAFFPSPTKPDPIPDPRPALRALPPSFRLPVYAIGGITPERLSKVVAEPHVRGVVVSSAIQSASDPAAVARALRERLAPLAHGE